MPPHDIYIEPFLGSGSILRLKRAAEKTIGIDLSSEVIHEWRSLLAGKIDPAAAFSRISHGWSPNLVASPSAAITAALSISGDAAGRIDVSGDTRRRRPVFPAMLDPRSLTIKRGDGIEFLESYDFRGTELVYCDPPYLMSTRTCRLYEYEMPDRDHRHLLRVIRKMKARVMISGYDSQMYRDGLPGWNLLQFEVTTRGNKRATECLWYNYPKPVELHDYRYLGENFREREKMKKMKARWKARLAGMPPLKRQALMSAILEASPEKTGQAR